MLVVGAVVLETVHAEPVLATRVEDRPSTSYRVVSLSR